MESTKYYLGLDVGGTNMVAGVVDENHQIIAKESIPTQAGRTIEEITTDMAEVSKKAVLKAGLQMEDISSWGIGMPSYVRRTFWYMPIVSDGRMSPSTTI